MFKYIQKKQYLFLLLTSIPVLLGTTLTVKYRQVQFTNFILMLLFYIFSNIGTWLLETYQTNKFKEQNKRHLKENSARMLLIILLFLLAAVIALFIGLRTHPLLIFLLFMHIAISWIINDTIIPISNTIYLEILVTIFMAILPTLLSFYVQIQFINFEVLKISIFPALFSLIYILLKHRSFNGHFKIVSYVLFFAPYLYLLLLIATKNIPFVSIISFSAIPYAIRSLVFMKTRKDFNTSILAYQVAYLIFAGSLIISFLLTQ